jgi:hypothetical protein
MALAVAETANVDLELPSRSSNRPGVAGLARFKAVGKEGSDYSRSQSATE